MKLLKKIKRIFNSILQLIGIKTKKNIIKPVKEENAIKEYNKRKTKSIIKDLVYVSFITDLFPNFNQLSFPEIIFPKNGTKIIHPKRNIARNGLVGKTEKIFKDYLNRYFPSFNLSDNNRLYNYEPDFALISEENGIYIDIEIDEPYSGIDRKPIHFIDADLERNIHFTESGWIVIRFAEEQIKRQPDACCKVIAKVLSSLDNAYIIPSKLYNFDDIIAIDKWSYEKALDMAYKNKREGYLGETFGNAIVIERHTNFEKISIKSDYLNKLAERIKKANRKKSYNNKSVVFDSVKPKEIVKIKDPSSELNLKKPVSKKETSLRERANTINRGVAVTSSLGNINTKEGKSHQPHRFHANEKELKEINRRFLSEKPNLFSVSIIQKQSIEKNYDFLNCEIKNNKLICKGSIHPKYCDNYSIKIVYTSNNYPEIFIKAKNHDIKASEVIHMYSDKSLCLFYVPDHKWSSKTKISETIIPWVAEWIIFYELYLITGKWYGAESPYHINADDEFKEVLHM